eukprot:501667_1
MFKPNREFQAGLQTEDSRRRRQENSLSLRRKDREHRLQQKRQKIHKTRSRQQQEQRQQTESNQEMENERNSIQLDTSLMYGNDEYLECNINRSAMLRDLPKWVEGCFQNHPAAQYECCKCIRRLLSIEKNPPIQEVIASGVVPRLIQFLRCHKYDALQFEAAWTITNIASGTAENTAKVITNGAVPVFVDLIKSKSYQVQEQAIWALGNIAG